MKHGHSFAIGVLALFLTACGGGGSHDSSSNNLNPSVSTPRVEAVVTGSAADPLYFYQDPLSIEVGDTIRFQLVTYDASNNRTVLSTVLWSTSNLVTSGGSTLPVSYDSVSASSGDYIAPSNDSNGISLVVTGRYNNTDYSASYRVNPRQVRVLGRLLVQGTLAPIRDAIVDIYGPRNPNDSTSALDLLASVPTTENGTFRASVRATNDAVAAGGTAGPLYFTLRTGSIPKTGFYDSFVFRKLRYDTGNTACLAPLTYADGSPLKSGNDPLIDSTTTYTDSSGAAITDPATIATLNGTILLTPTSAFTTRPSSDGCSGTSG